MEIWKDIKGFEGHYQISDKGRVKSIERKNWYNHCTTGKRLTKKSKERILSNRNCKGYATIQLCKIGGNKQFRICRLVATAFIENNEQKPCVNHIDGNKLNDNVSNLEWCTYKENMKHALENGLTNFKMGADCKSSKKVICKKDGKIYDSIRDAAKYYKVDASNLSRAIRGHYKNHRELYFYKD